MKSMHAYFGDLGQSLLYLYNTSIPMNALHPLLNTYSYQKGYAKHKNKGIDNDLILVRNKLNKILHETMFYDMHHKLLLLCEFDFFFFYLYKK